MILILGTPRSGTSMTAGVFAEHGVWTGTCRPPTPWNPKGFFENLSVKRILVEECGAIVHEGRVAEPLEGFKAKVEQAIKQDGYDSGPWLWKGSALYHRVWQDFKPKIVCCYRDIEAIFKSCRDSGIFGGRLDGDRLREVLRLHHAEMDSLNALKVNTAQVAQGNFESIQKAIEGCGLRYDENKVRAFVEPKFWRH